MFSSCLARGKYETHALLREQLRMAVAPKHIGLEVITGFCTDALMLLHGVYNYLGAR